MVEGTVKFFNPMKNFGFINGDDGKDYFVHSSGLKEGVTVKEGDKVSFKAVEGDKGIRAEDVVKAGDAAEVKDEEPAEEVEETPAEETPAEEETDTEEEKTEDK